MRSEVQDLLDLNIASDCIVGLLEVSLLLYKAKTRDRFMKALQDRRHPFLDQFDINYVQERFPKLARPGANWLLKRAITNRRQYLRYCREHRERLSADTAKRGPIDGTLSKTNVIIKQPRKADEIEYIAQSLVRSSNQASGAAYIIPSTKASTVDVARLAAVETENDDGGETYSSAGSLVDLLEGDTCMHLTSLEEVSEGKTMSECIFCHELKSFSRGRSWKRHAYQDLKAYPCTLGKGKCDQYLATARNGSNMSSSTIDGSWSVQYARELPFDPSLVSWLTPKHYMPSWVKHNSLS
ncbi:hypothetical protein F4809DRAFT_601514 [Biscogniauxia mediterranea]|nr:hypothetical protein F4809DRAFT_601514 [Biscogniauxia mediterranea]